jgi:hypothetical protein
MKKIVRLTETDLVKLVKRVIMEQSNTKDGIVYSVQKLPTGKFKIFVTTPTVQTPTDAYTVFGGGSKWKEYNTQQEAQDVINSYVNAGKPQSNYISKNPIKEQNSNLQNSSNINDFMSLHKKLLSKYSDVCKYDTLKDYGGGLKDVKLNTGGKVYPFDPEVKRFQELYNKLSEYKLKVDGIIGPETKKVICLKS